MSVGYARFHIKNNNASKAIDILQSSIPFHLDKDPFYEETYRLLGKSFAVQKDTIQAKKYFQASKELNQFDLKNNQLAKTELAEGMMHAEFENYKEALKHYQKALINLDDTFDNINISSNPQNFDQFLAKKTLLKTLHQKAVALYHLDKKESQTIAWSTIKIAMKLVDNIGNDNSADYDKQFLIKENYSIFEDAIRISLAQPNEKGLHYAFEVAEKSKANLLLAAVRNTQIQDYGVPDSLIDLEQDIKFQLINLAERRYETKKSEEPAQEVDNDIAQFNKDLESLNQTLKRDYKSYFLLKNDRSVDDIELVKKRLEDEQAFVEYFIGEKNSYAFFTTKEQDIKVVEISISKEKLTGLVQDFLYSIYIPSVEATNPTITELKKKYTSDYADTVYANIGFELYNDLLRPILNELDTEVSNLQIIPDDVLNYLPFDALLQAMVPQDKIGLYGNKQDYQYLAHTHQISYCYSGTLLGLMQSENSTLALKPELLIFDGLGFETQTQFIYDFFSSLHFIKPFARLLRKDSNEDKLKEQGRNYQYLHFSAHGIINNERPHQSHLKLRSAEADTLDSPLYLQTIYGLDLPAKMVFTSACDAGIGPMQKGQGLMSLARGFAYSGAKSLVTTLWSVDIGASGKLVPKFYEHLSEGMNKDKALFMTKKELLTKVNTAHPFHWAGFIPIGNMEAVTMPMTLVQLICRLSLVIFLLLILYYIYRKYKDE